MEEKRQKYFNSIEIILAKNPYLSNQISTGYQDFKTIIDKGYFYVDKSTFLEEWWELPDHVSLFTRPRRFGKTLMLSMMEYFFSNRMDHCAYLFEKLAVANNSNLLKELGQWPVIMLTFAGVKQVNCKDALRQMAWSMYGAYSAHEYILTSDGLSAVMKNEYRKRLTAYMSSQPTEIESALSFLCNCLYQYNGKKVILLLDEYDTPLQEAYVKGYFDEFITIYRNIIADGFKQNAFLEKGMITGISKIAKNSLFSDANNIRAYSILDDTAATAWGFTEDEVKQILLCQDVEEFQQVKSWYDGFTIGRHSDIYNPWSIGEYIKERQLYPYWINTSSNDLIGQLIRSNWISVKRHIEDLLAGKRVRVHLDENLAMQYSDGDENSFWALLVTIGYIKVESFVRLDGECEADVAITNYECMLMFQKQIQTMFGKDNRFKDDFANALLNRDVELMNIYLNDLIYSSISYFDTGKTCSQRAPENFYHGLVLGLITTLKDRYVITSNRESGYGRYDIAMKPLNQEDFAYIIEFKVRDERKEKNLEETARFALKQIEEKQYEAGLIADGIARDRIMKLGFAFEAKEALVVERVFETNSNQSDYAGRSKDE